VDGAGVEELGIAPGVPLVGEALPDEPLLELPSPELTDPMNLFGL
jgi:hypothetical protein